MGGKKNVQLVKPINDQADWMLLTENAQEKRLIVIDVQNNLFGPTDIMNLVVKSISLEMEEWEKRVAFFTVSTAALECLANENDSAKPKFLFYLRGERKAEMVGANGPE